MRIPAAIAASCLLAAGLFAGCSTGVGPAVRADLSGIDPAAAELIGRLIARIAADPDSAEARANLGMAYEVNGLNQAARDSFAQAVALSPGTARWHYYEGLVLSKLGDIEAAVAALERVVERDDRYAPAYLYLGQFQLDMGRVDEAMVSFRRDSCSRMV